MQSLETITASYEASKKRMEDEVQAALKQAFGEFFAANPAIGYVKWTQYTPHFNDGDPCWFNVHDFYYALKPEHYVDEDVREEVERRNYSTYELEELEDEEVQGVDLAAVKAAFSDFVEAIGKVPDEIFEGAFGDHVEVTASATGFDIDEYDHD